jgi:glucose/arabinose dehydrogenase
VRRTSSCVVPALLVLASAAAAQPDLSRFYVRQGYELTVLLDGIEGARFMEIDDRGTLYVSSMSAGTIRAFKPEGDGYAPLGTFVSDHETVQGMQFHEGWMWFATESGISKARDTDADGEADQTADVLTGLPGGGHNWRPILVASDGFYTSIGDGGNITDQVNTDRQKIWKYSLDGASREVFASGVRNTEKLRFRPGTTEIWGFDHGSDWFGRRVGDKNGNQPITDLNPPDELNLYVQGGFYGHPFIVGSRLPRYEFMDRTDIHELAEKTIVPQWPVGAHWACNGWTFVTAPAAPGPGAMPADHAGDIFVAAHGSWNSTWRVGYCLARILFDKDPKSDRFGRPVGLMKVVGTLAANGVDVLDRPVDCIQAPDGTLLMSTDQRGRVYRVRYTGE